jgi:hypothetical protein
MMPGAPNFLIGLYENAAEFVASLDGLFATWDEELIGYYGRLAGLTEDGTGELDRLRLQLQDFVADARSVLALLGSPTLVGSAVDADTMRRLLAAAGFERTRDAFNDKVEQILNDRLRRATAAADERRLRQARAQRGRLNTLLAIITAAGVSGLAQLLQQGFGWGAGPSLILFSAVIVVAIGVGLVWSLADR